MESPSAKSNILGKVLRIEKTSMYDGAGLRTVVYLKGCPLKCSWCSTPESQKFLPEIGLLSHLCTKCGTCLDTCPVEALSLSETDGLQLDSSLCDKCMKCVKSCPNKAIKQYGQIYSPDEIFEEIKKDEIFYFHSGGGLTFSGGECLSQAKFVTAVLKMCREIGINTTLETSLHAKWADIEGIIPYLNSIFVDVKHGISDDHLQVTGVNTDLILDNLIKLDRDGRVPINIRIPIIPVINDSDESLLGVRKILAGLKNVQSLELLPYHRLGVATYSYLKRSYKLPEILIPSKSYMQEKAKLLTSEKNYYKIIVSGNS